MVGKFVVRPGQLDFWHVAGHAFVLGHLAGLRARFPAAVAGQTLWVVIERLAAQFVVRVMAREATDPRVIRVVALAARQPVRLEANVPYPQVTLKHNLFPRAVTLPAEVGDLLRGEVA